MAELTRRYIIMTMATEGPFDRTDPDTAFVLKPWKDPAALRALETYRAHCYPELGEEIGAWIAEISEKLKPGTVQLHLVVMRLLLEYAGVDPNPARDARVKLPKRVREEPQPPPAEHVEAILAAIGPKWRLMMITIEQGALRTTRAARRHHAGPDLLDDFFPRLGARAHARDVERVEHQAGDLRSPVGWSKCDGPTGFNDEIVGDRLVVVAGPEGVRTSRKQHRLLGLRGTLDDRGRALVNGFPWDSDQALRLVRDARRGGCGVLIQGSRAAAPPATRHAGW